MNNQDQPKTEVDKPPSIDVVAVARELLKLQRQQDVWHDAVNQEGLIEVHDPISENWALLYLALDLLGEPKDSTMSNDDESIEGPDVSIDGLEGAYCRDLIVEVYDIMVAKRNDIEGYIEVVTGKRERYPKGDADGWYNWDQLESHFYPEQ